MPLYQFHSVSHCQRAAIRHGDGDADFQIYYQHSLSVLDSLWDQDIFGHIMLAQPT